jgi:hypothetical protein
VPEHAPLQPLNTAPEAGAAARSTIVPDGKVTEQLKPQLIPAGELVTEPDAVPNKLTERLNAGTKVAVMAVFEFRVTVHGPAPAQSEDPLQKANMEPAVGVGVSVTAVPESNKAEQVAPQLIPAGALVMVPAPVPAFVSESVNCCVGGGPKFATTD